MKRLIAGAAIAGVAIWGATGAFDDNTTRDATGAITEGGGLGAMVIREGDCFNLPSDYLVVSVEAIPCTSAHDAEVYANFDIPPATGAFPGEAKVSELADNGCIQRFPAFVGKSYLDSELFFTWLAPTAETWAEGDRVVTCAVMTGDGSKLTGTMYGSGR